VTWIQIEPRDGVTAFRPGDEVAGTVRWRLDRPPASFLLRLLWYTEGAGGQDVGVVESTLLAEPGQEGSSPFRFRLPPGPYSFSGKLISLLWAVEAVVEPGIEPGDGAERLKITMSPTGRAIQLRQPAGEVGER
jgi:hypothetical protein